MFSILRTEATIGVADYIATYHDPERVLGYCRQCPNFGQVWCCPPFDFEVKAYLSGYTTARIFATKIELPHRPCDIDTPALATRALDAAWAIELPRLYELESSTPGSRIFTGRCRLCRPASCTRAQGQPCRHSHKMRHSLEALGFDLERTSRELLGITLQWGAEGKPPPYLTLITAIFW